MKMKITLVLLVLLAAISSAAALDPITITAGPNAAVFSPGAFAAGGPYNVYNVVAPGAGAGFVVSAKGLIALAVVPSAVQGSAAAEFQGSQPATPQQAALVGPLWVGSNGVVQTALGYDGNSVTTPDAIVSVGVSKNSQGWGPSLAIANVGSFAGDLAILPITAVIMATAADDFALGGTGQFAFMFLSPESVGVADTSGASSFDVQKVNDEPSQNTPHIAGVVNADIRMDGQTGTIPTNSVGIPIPAQAPYTFGFMSIGSAAFATSIASEDQTNLGVSAGQSVVANGAIGLVASLNNANMIAELLGATTAEAWDGAFVGQQTANVNENALVTNDIDMPLIAISDRESAAAAFAITGNIAFHTASPIYYVLPEGLDSKDLVDDYQNPICGDNCLGLVPLFVPGILDNEPCLGPNCESVQALAVVGRQFIQAAMATPNLPLAVTCADNQPCDLCDNALPEGSLEFAGRLFMNQGLQVLLGSSIDNQPCDGCVEIPEIPVTPECPCSCGCPDDAAKGVCVDIPCDGNCPNTDSFCPPCPGCAPGTTLRPAPEWPQGGLLGAMMPEGMLAELLKQMGESNPLGLIPTFEQLIICQDGLCSDAKALGADPINLAAINIGTAGAAVWQADVDAQNDNRVRAGADAWVLGDSLARATKQDEYTLSTVDDGSTHAGAHLNRGGGIWGTGLVASTSSLAFVLQGSAVDDTVGLHANLAAYGILTNGPGMTGSVLDDAGSTLEMTNGFMDANLNGRSYTTNVDNLGFDINWIVGNNPNFNLNQNPATVTESSPTSGTSSAQGRLDITFRTTFPDTTRHDIALLALLNAGT